jgi:hypothetical protein
MNRHDRRKASKQSRGLRLSPQLRSLIVREARELFQQVSPMMADHWGTCVYETAALIAVAQKHGCTAENGLEILPQAGSAFWRRIPHRDDDGVTDTHWGFEYDTSTLAPGDMCGLPLEVHVWAAMPTTGEIIDISTRGWPESCAGAGGLPWPGPRPPDHLWVKANKRHPNSIYVPNQDATQRAYQAVLDIWSTWQRGEQFVPVTQPPNGVTSE